MGLGKVRHKPLGEELTEGQEEQASTGPPPNAASTLALHSLQFSAHRIVTFPYGSTSGDPSCRQFLNFTACSFFSQPEKDQTTLSHWCQG